MEPQQEAEGQHVPVGQPADQPAELPAVLPVGAGGGPSHNSLCKVFSGSSPSPAPPPPGLSSFSPFPSPCLVTCIEEYAEP